MRRTSTVIIVATLIAAGGELIAVQGYDQVSHHDPWGWVGIFAGAFLFFSSIIIAARLPKPPDDDGR